MKKERFVYPKYGESDYLPWVSKIFSKREITRLQNKIRKLERALEKSENRRREHLEFEYAFRRFLDRFKNHKWKSDWPFERFLEALTYLEDKLP